MKKQTITFLTALAMLLFAGSVTANNINVTNIRLTGQNTTAGVNNAANYSLVQFDLSWENSWRTSSAPNNWDAAWVFVKYRVGNGDWQHAWLNDIGHSGGSGTGATIAVGLLTPGTAFNINTNPALGVFICRSANGTGTFSISNAQLRWNYGANGIADNATVDVQVFAVEMVYVPQGSFYVGSGGSGSGSFTNGPWTSGATIPLQITSESALTIAQIAGNLWGTSSSGYNTIGGAGTLPAAFPKGYAGFYCMKYEISQQQYVDFLNTLTRAQQNSRTSTSLPAGTTSVTNHYVMSGTNTITVRNGIRCNASIHTSDPITFYCDLNGNGTGGEADDGQWIACNYLSWMDGAAYSDWAGLRPMTELEYEKACRGTAAPVANEYAWGTNSVASTAYTLENSSGANEGIANNYSTDAGNASYSSTDGTINGPLRVGIFAANTSNTGRITAGASYYGIMELSGNLWERAVTVGNAKGRAFTGLHGNGVLSTAGHADETAWPGLFGGAVTGATGSGFRGGLWSTDASDVRVSDRSSAAYTDPARYNSYGFRAVRAVP